MKHCASSDFWACYQRLPEPIRDLADRCYDLLKENPRHPSLHFKKVGRFRSVRVGLDYRALGVDSPLGIVWFWIGPHEEYDRLLR